MAALHPHLTAVRKIWDSSPHNAFTDLIRFRGLWFCTFREGKSHALCPGKIRVLVSSDGVTWNSASLLSRRGIDLRDPKFVPASKGKIGLVMGATVLKKGIPVQRYSQVSWSGNGLDWSPPVQIGEEGDWLWRLERNEGVFYSITYRLPEKRRWTVHVLKSENGLDWKEISALDVPGLPNEALIRFRENGATALVRREEGDGYAWIGTSRRPYASWRWNETEVRVGGPNFIFLPDGKPIAAARILRDGKPVVALCAMTKKSLAPVLYLPSGNDCGYPGMVLHRGKLWISYYSSHERKARIYIAEISLRRAKTLNPGRTPS